MKRLILIHGYLEDPGIFDHLAPLLMPAYFVPVDLKDEFARWQPKGPINARQLAQYLTDYYEITADDVLIGHSMGGWIAVNIKQLTGATTVQLGSWTNQKKINFPVTNLRLLRLMLFGGITQSSWLMAFFKKQYPFAESRALYNQLVDGGRLQERTYVYQQQMTLFGTVPPLTVQPDLRIHARPDSIVFPPDEPFAEVPGDHFSLYFHPEHVAQPILELLSQKASPVNT
ncbi:alpha/beta hydrolase [Rudanella paleaurantiibacter]|uniref:Alpha/beta hydrolase n=1 Tax=Rudanella paleaurantiibacter TaxID=2614655 RepID=A0A7J5U329_9BACT|nr:alpha/beta hydrolase [Rudanella paleaurantiibacter]KAB7732101.1 alpha/beta hydrolase [Rudanella paleaurantiibacter]